MDETKALCMGCMHPLPDGRESCGLCGYPANGENPSEYLSVGSHLSDRYIVGRVLSAGSEAAVYIGYDEADKSAVQIREFLPATIATRKEDGSLAPIGGCEDTFAEYLKAFCAHVRMLAHLRDVPILVPVFDIFEQNGTAYAVSDYEEGCSLTTYLKRAGGRLSWEEARRLFLPFCTAMISCHAAGAYHYGICPENLLVDGEGKLRLTEWALPQVRTVNTDLKPQLQTGYAAPEQYEFERDCSPATDVYGLSATLFHTLTGNPPPDGSQRDSQGRDLLLPADAADSIPKHVAAAMAGGLQALPDKRIQTILELRDQLSSGGVVSSLTTDGTAAKKPVAKNPLRKYFLIFGISAILLVFVVAAVVLFALYPDLFSSGDSNPTTSTTVATPTLPTTTTSSTVTQQTAAKQTTPDLAGSQQDYFLLTSSSQGVAIYQEFTVELAGLVFSDLPYGTIVAQSPAAGEAIDLAGTIQVFISAGPQQTTVPDVSGWVGEHAKLYLEALGFRVTLVEEDIPNTEKGTVIGSWPTAGSAPDAGNAITLRISVWTPPTSTSRQETSATTTTTTKTPTEDTQPELPDDAGNI